MVQRNKIDSNETELSMALEVIGAPGTLPATPVWIGLEPNDYDKFGGENELLARRPINSSRQRKKGAIVDLDASGGFNQDFTNENSQILISGFMYAQPREKANAVGGAITATGVEVDDAAGFLVGSIIKMTGYASALNALPTVVEDIAANVLEIPGLVAEANDIGRSVQVVGHRFPVGDVSVAVVDGLPALVSDATDMTTFGVEPGEFVFVGGDGGNMRFATAANNGIKRVKEVREDAILFDKSDLPMVAEVFAGASIDLYFGRVIKNELAEKIVRQTFQFERKLGAPDTDQPTQMQGEYITGAYPNEFEMKIETADKINADYSFIAMNSDQRTATEGLKAGLRTMVDEGDMYNTSTDFSRAMLAVVTPGQPAPEPLFEFMTELTLKINNNVSLNKAIGVLGGFDATIGLFEVSAEIEAYFSRVESINAIKRNKDVTLDFFCTKDNKGFAVDLPLVALGDGLADISLDDPIKIPLTSEAATAVKYDPNFNHTLLWTFFDYLPDLAYGG